MKVWVNTKTNIYYHIYDEIVIYFQVKSDYQAQWFSNRRHMVPREKIGEKVTFEMREE